MTASRNAGLLLAHRRGRWANNKPAVIAYIRNKPFWSTSFKLYPEMIFCGTYSTASIAMFMGKLLSMSMVWYCTLPESIIAWGQIHCGQISALWQHLLCEFKNRLVQEFQRNIMFLPPPPQRWDIFNSMLCPHVRHFTLTCSTSLGCKW